MNLTIDARLINSSGIGVYLQNVLKSNQLKKYELKLLYKKEEKSFFKDIAAIAEMIPYDAPLYSIKELLQTPAKTKGADIFWSPHFNVPVINHAKKLKIVTIHDVFHLAHYDTLGAAQKIYAKLMYQRAVQSSDLIFTVSETSKKEIIQYTGMAAAEKIKVVYNGIDFEKFNTIVERKTRDKILENYRIHFPFVLFVGNVKPHKNLRNGLLGFKEYLLTNTAGSEIKFLIAGRREGFITGDKDIDQLIQDPVLKDHVHFTGWVRHEDLPAIYQEAKAFVFPSFYEGFGFPPLEAMAAGCPVISSNASCMTEIYDDAVLYFDPANISAINLSFHKILHSEPLRHSLIEKGYKQAGKYSWDAAVNKKMDWIEAYL